MKRHLLRNHFDVLVVGGGNAALIAALSAQEAGASVIILDASTREERGGNSRFAGAIFRIAHTGMEQLLPLLDADALPDVSTVNVEPYTVERYTGDMLAMSAGKADPMQMQAVAERGYDTVRWMQAKGVKWELNVGKYFSRDAAKGAVVTLPPGAELRAHREGVGLTDSLWAAVEQAGIEVCYDSPAHDLILQGDSIRGVRVRRSADYSDYFGQVVLACGGFEANPAMRRQYLGEGWDLVIVRGTRFNKGVMLERALHAGAKPAGHWGGCHCSPQDLHAPAYGNLKRHNGTSRYSYPFSIMVNAQGERFIDEGEDQFPFTYAKTGAEIRKQPGAVAYQVFDQKVLHLLEPRYQSSTPIIDESLTGLEQKLNMRSGSLTRTIEEFNAACSGRETDPFQKDGVCTRPGLTPPKSNWALKIDRGPFVAYAVTCGVTFTYGGVTADASGRVVNNEDRPMPGLFAAGEIVGGLFFHNYPGGAGLTKGAVFGRIAGAAAAAAAREAEALSTQ